MESKSLNLLSSVCLDVNATPGFVKEFFRRIVCSLFLLASALANAQTPQPSSPQDNAGSATPQFSGVQSTLSSSVTYTVAVSESARGGSTSQYVNFWVKTNLQLSDLSQSNPGRLIWGSGWEQRIRGGGYDAAVSQIIAGSPPKLTPGKRYYWHIVGSNTTKSAEASFRVENVPAQPVLNSICNVNRNLFEVSWNTVANATRYELTRNNSALSLGAATTSGSLMKIDVSVSTPDIAESFNVRACNNIGCSLGQSAPAKCPIPPKVPSIFLPTNGANTTNVPTFSALASSLQLSARYSVAISESPRAGINNQYVDFWSMQDLPDTKLMETNPDRVIWSSQWVKRTRNGNPDGQAQIVSGSAPIALTVGKTYYWHVIAIAPNGGVSKSTEGRFTVTVDKGTIGQVTNKTQFNSNTGSTTPCFLWEAQAGYDSSIELFVTENGVKKLFARKNKGVNVAENTYVCLDKTWSYELGNKLPIALPLNSWIFWQIKTFWPEINSYKLYQQGDFLTRPNIVIIYADDLGWNDVNTNVGNGPSTGYAAIQALSTKSNSVTFSNAYANAAICSPSRASLLSGKYPAQHKVYSVNNKSQKDLGKKVHTEPQLVSSRLLSEHLKQAGYTTAIIGKWHLFGAGVNDSTDTWQELSDWRATKKGFDINWGGNQSGKPVAYQCNGTPCIFKGSLAPDPFTSTLPKVYFTNQGVEKFEHLLKGSSAPVVEDEPNDLSSVLRAITKRYILEQSSYTALENRRPSQPFFIYNALYEPHEPLGCTYSCMVGRVNQAVESVKTGLEGDGKNLDKTNSTYVIFTSDNGHHPNQAAANADAIKGYKGLHYEGGIREPLVISGPGIVANKINTPVIGSDIYPTVLGLAGVPVTDAGIDGQDIRGFLISDPQFSSVKIPLPPTDTSRALFWFNPIVHHNNVENISGAGMAVRSNGYKLISHFYPHTSSTGTYQLAELYNISTDPKESCNLLLPATINNSLICNLPRNTIKAQYSALKDLLKIYVCGSQTKLGIGDSPLDYKTVALDNPNYSITAMNKYKFLPEFDELPLLLTQSAVSQNIFLSPVLCP